MINKKIKIIVFILIFKIINLSLYAKENKIIAKIENEIVTSYELKNKIRTTLIMANQEVNQENVNKTKRRALISLINSKLKKYEISKYNLKAEDKSVNNQLMNISSNNIPALKEQFRNNNLNYQLFIEEIKIDLAWQTLVYSLFNEKVKVNYEEIDRELESLIKNQKNIEEYKISEIEIYVENNENVKKKIELITEEIKKVGFDNAAMKYSVSSSSTKKGDLGWINAKTLSEKIYRVIKEMEIGEVSPPLESFENFLLLKLVDRRISQIKNLDREQLRKNLITQKENELYNLYSRSHLSKIRNNALIEYK